MTDFLRKLTDKSGFDKALIGRALDFTKSLDISEFYRLLFQAEQCSVENTGVLYFEEAFYPYDFFTRLRQLDISPEVAALYIYIALSEKAFAEFTNRIGDEDIFFDTMARLSEDARGYLMSRGYDGLYDYIFLANHIRGNILRLSGFEYQLGQYENSKAILLHLPENADLSKENRLKSYGLARKYFGDYPIIADSWLLFPEHKKMLSEDSRILDFTGDFDTVSVSETTDYAEAFHIFGRLSDYSYENLPKSTTLQKAYAERIKAGLTIGSGVGVLKY